MRVSRLISDDWAFGKGKANYAANSEAIRQNVKTRLRSFTNDWFLDVTKHIDWFNILGSKNNEETIKNEVTRVVLETEGVLTLDGYELTSTKREATINIKFTDVFGANVPTTVTIPIEG
jgi:Tfp pilus assembly protein FimT